MAPATNKRRPPQLMVSHDKANSDAILRIVSPIAPLMMTGEMRNTLRLSQMVRAQQNNLIAAGQYKEPASGASSAANDSSEDDASDAKDAMDGDAKAPEAHGIDDSADTTAPERSDDADDRASGGSLAESPELSAEFVRLTNTLALKKLKRKHAPGPLLISPASQARVAPSISSAPMRTVYGYYPQKRVPVRYVYPMYSAVPYVQPVVLTPLRRNIPTSARERGRVHARRRPVLDVFPGDVTKAAPMPSQPPSAHVEYFDDRDDDNLVATEEEMREMERKREASDALLGSITFNDESAFNFKIFRSKEGDAKRKFMKICETTWDEFMARP